MKKALIAMSGGVDSSVAALLMQQKGYECVGATMKLFENEQAGVKREKTCCSLDDVEDARSVTYRLHMPYYVFNFTANFEKEVMDRFVHAYENGWTPNPCIDCNRYLKFEKLYLRMQEMQMDTIVTGHYARVAYDETSGRYLLKKGLDGSKDQSYVLYNLTQEQLAHTLMPVGEYTKDEIRVLAEEAGLPVAHKPDSQEICFVPDNDYVSFIDREAGEKVPGPGNFVTEDGRILGRHKGITHYTLGQRRGLELPMGERVFVTAIRPETNEVVIGSNQELFTDKVLCDHVNYMTVEDLTEPTRVLAKIRYNHKGEYGTLTKQPDGKVLCTFDAPVRAATPGQAMVFYQDEHVLGGGTIIL